MPTKGKHCMPTFTLMLESYISDVFKHFQFQLLKSKKSFNSIKNC